MLKRIIRFVQIDFAYRVRSARCEVVTGFLCESFGPSEVDDISEFVFVFYNNLSESRDFDFVICQIP